MKLVADNIKADLEEERTFKGIWMPAEIYLHENLNWPEKFILVEIDALDKGQGCFASNAHFSKHLRINETNVSRMISKLAKLGFIKATYEYRRGTKQIAKRFLKSVFSLKDFTPLPLAENSKTPLAENSKDKETEFKKLNNTKRDNSISYIEAKDSVEILSPEILKFKDAFPRKIVNCEWDNSLNIDNLITAINESDFLKSDETANLTLSWYIKNYNKVVVEKVWKKFERPLKANSPKQYEQRTAYRGRKYTKEELNSLFDNIEDVEV